MKQELIPRDKLIVGEIYTHVYNDKRNNVFCWGGNDALYSTEGARSGYCDRPGGNFNGTIMEATPFEKEWLTEMRKIRKFIPEKEFIFDIEPNYQIY
jgi:hypothetical protein